MNRALAGLLTSCLVLAALPAGSEPPCRASLRIEPREPFVEQGVSWQLEITSRDDLDRVEWIRAPAFPGARVERVTILPDARDDAGRRIRRDERVFFPERAGPLRLPIARLACGSEERWHEVMLEPQQLEVRPLPEEGRPADFQGLVGAVTIRRYLRPERVVLGETARITVSLRGSGNLWAASDPLRELELPDAELFPRSAQAGIERSGGLRVTRVFEVDVVPRRGGVLQLPPLRVDWFDPDDGGYRSEAVPAADLLVTERPASAAAPPPAQAGEREAPGRGAVRESLPAAWLWVGLRALLVLGLLAAITWQVRQRRRRRPRLVSEVASGPGTHAGDERARSAERALRAALALALPEDWSRAATELLTRDDLTAAQRTVAELLLRLERTRFDRGVTLPEPDEISRAVDALRRERP